MPAFWAEHGGRGVSNERDCGSASRRGKKWVRRRIPLRGRSAGENFWGGTRSRFRGLDARRVKTTENRGGVRVAKGKSQGSLSFCCLTGLEERKSIFSSRISSKYEIDRIVVGSSLGRNSESTIGGSMRGHHQSCYDKSATTLAGVKVNGKGKSNDRNQMMGKVIRSH